MKGPWTKTTEGEALNVGSGGRVGESNGGTWGQL